MQRRAVLAGLTLGSAAPALADPPGAGPWAPDRSVRLVVPFPPGGPTDLVARPLAARLTQVLGQQVVVDNRGGAGGNLGAEAVARAAPDGLTLLLSNVGVLAVNPSLYRRLPFEPERDFAPIAVLAGAPVALVVNPTVPATNVSEFVAWTREQRGAVPFGSAGAGSPGHLVGEVFRSLTGAALSHLPYRGSAPALQDVVAGHIQVMFDPVQSPLAQLQAGRVRALAVSAPARSLALPAVPTMAEAGVPGLEFVAWWALVAPAATPAPALARYAAEVERLDTDPAWRTGLVRQGISPMFRGPVAMPAFLRAETVRWGAAVQASGASAE